MLPGDLKPGEIVIVRSNEEEMVLVATFQYYDQECHFIPVVKNFSGQKLWVSGIILPYDEKLFQTLKKMGGKEGWNYLKNKKNSISE